MELTPEEKQELATFVQYQKECMFIPSNKRHRFTYLRLKKFHKHCSNMFCKGYQGTEEETKCPLCNFDLYNFDLTGKANGTK